MSKSRAEQRPAVHTQDGTALQSACADTTELYMGPDKFTLVFLIFLLLLKKKGNL